MKTTVRSKRDLDQVVISPTNAADLAPWGIDANDPLLQGFIAIIDPYGRVEAILSAIDCANRYEIKTNNGNGATNNNGK